MGGSNSLYGSRALVLKSEPPYSEKNPLRLQLVMLNAHPVLTQSHPGYLDSFKKHMNLWLPQFLWDYHTMFLSWCTGLCAWLTYNVQKLMSCQYLNLYLPIIILINEIVLYCLHRSCLLSLLYLHRKYFLWLKWLFIHLSTWRNFEQEKSRPMAKFCVAFFFYFQVGLLSSY